MEVTRGRATLVLREKRNPATSSHTKKWKKTMNQSKEKNLRERGAAAQGREETTSVRGRVGWQK